MATSLQCLLMMPSELVSLWCLLSLFSLGYLINSRESVKISFAGNKGVAAHSAVILSLQILLSSSYDSLPNKQPTEIFAVWIGSY